MQMLVKVHRISPCLVRATSCDDERDFGEQLWTAGKSRVPGECAISNEPFEAGATVYRPVRGSGNRKWRVLDREITRRAELHVKRRA